MIEANFITKECLVKPLEAKENELLLVHTKNYLKSLKVSIEHKKKISLINFKFDVVLINLYIFSGVVKWQ